MGALLNIKGLLLALAVGALIGGVSAGRAVYVLQQAKAQKIDVAALNETIAVLQGRVTALQEASTKDNARAAVAEMDRNKYKGMADALRAKISKGACFTLDDSNTLRMLWDRKDRAPDRRYQVRPAVPGQ